MWLAIPAPANTLLKQEGLQLAEASFHDKIALTNHNALSFSEPGEV